MQSLRLCLLRPCDPKMLHIWEKEKECLGLGLFSLCLGFTPPTLLIFFSCKTFLGRRRYDYNDHTVFFEWVWPPVCKEKMTKPSSALWERNILEAMLSVPFVPLSICPRSNIYVSLLNSEPSFLSCFLLCWSLTTFTLLHCAAARLSVPPHRLCYLTFPVSALLRQPFLASFMFSLINYSISDAKVALTVNKLKMI